MNFPFVNWRNWIMTYNKLLKSQAGKHKKEESHSSAGWSSSWSIPDAPVQVKTRRGGKRPKCVSIRYCWNRWRKRFMSLSIKTMLANWFGCRHIPHASAELGAAAAVLGFFVLLPTNPLRMAKQEQKRARPLFHTFTIIIYINSVSHYYSPEIQSHRCPRKHGSSGTAHGGMSRMDDEGGGWPNKNEWNLWDCPNAIN